MQKQDISVLTKEDALDLISRQWMLVTAGDGTSHNTMTASWGGIGFLWAKPVAILFIRPERYTHDFLEKFDTLTLSFYDESHRKALQICGSKSGRDGNKEAEAGLTPISTPEGMPTFAEARMTLACRKLFRTDMTDESFVDKNLLPRWYTGEHGGGMHTIYIVEIENVYC